MAATRAADSASSVTVGSSSSQSGAGVRHQTREREASLLSRRKKASWYIGEVFDAEGLKRVGSGPRGASEASPVVKIFRYRECWFHRIEVTDVVKPLAMGDPVLVDRSAIPSKCSASRPQQAAEDSKQTRFARAVRSDERKRTAGIEAERDPGEDRALPADAGHVARLETGGAQRSA